MPLQFDRWLVMRSLPTLPYRMQAHCANAQKGAEFLQPHAKVSVVRYPGLPDNPFHAVASKQVSGFGGMLSFEVKGGKDSAMALAANVEIFTRATSLGGVESLIEHRASTEGPDKKTPQSLLRVSVGLENADDVSSALTYCS